MSSVPGTVRGTRWCSLIQGQGCRGRSGCVRFSPPAPYTAPSPRCLSTGAVVWNPCLHAGHIRSRCLKQTAPMFLDETKFKRGLGSQNSHEKPFDLFLLLTPTSFSHPLRKTNTWPGSILNNFYYMFSVLYTKEISFFTVIQKKILIILAFSLLMQSVYKSVY